MIGIVCRDETSVREPRIQAIPDDLEDLPVLHRVLPFLRGPVLKTYPRSLDALAQSGPALGRRAGPSLGRAATRNRGWSSTGPPCGRPTPRPVPGGSSCL